MSFLTGLKPSSPDHLRVQCTRVRARLQLIPEFESWLDIALERYMLRNNNKSLTFRSTPDTTSQTLWHCFALGAPLCVLLDLLGATADRHIIKSLLLEELVENFVDRIQLLELQGRLPYGEVLRAEDLFGGTHQGFAKVG